MTVKKQALHTSAKKFTVTRSKKSAYETDFYEWTQKQAILLEKLEFEKVDVKNLIEELHALGNSEKRALENHIANLFLHLMKIDYQLSKQSKSWDFSVRNAKFQIKKLLKDNPSLKSKLPELIQDAYYVACLNAAAETGLDEKTFPKTCPWKKDDIL